MDVKPLLNAIKEAYKVPVSTQVKKMLVLCLGTLKHMLALQSVKDIIKLLNGYPDFAKDFVLSLICGNDSRLSEWIPAGANDQWTTQQSCDECQTLFEKDGFRICSPFEIRHCFCQAWCVSCASAKHSRNEMPWRTVPSSEAGA